MAFDKRRSLREEMISLGREAHYQGWRGAEGHLLDGKEGRCISIAHILPQHNADHSLNKLALGKLGYRVQCSTFRFSDLTRIATSMIHNPASMLSLFRHRLTLSRESNSSYSSYAFIKQSKHQTSMLPLSYVVQPLLAPFHPLSAEASPIEGSAGLCDLTEINK